MTHELLGHGRRRVYLRTTAMPSNTPIQNLRDAIFKEQAALTIMDTLYCEFIVKMLNYQTGKGEVPTVQEFAEWLDSVDRRIEFSRLRGLI